MWNSQSLATEMFRVSKTLSPPIMNLRPKIWVMLPDDCKDIDILLPDDCKDIDILNTFK